MNDKPSASTPEVAILMPVEPEGMAVESPSPAEDKRGETAKSLDDSPQIDAIDAPADGECSAAASDPQFSLCPQCGACLADDGACGECGFIGSGNETSAASLSSPSPPLDVGSLLLGQWEIVSRRGSRGLVNTYGGRRLSDGSAVLIREACGKSVEEDAKEASGEELSTADAAAPEGQSPPLETEGSREKCELSEPLARERDILQELNYPTIPKVLDAFVENGRCYLILEHLTGVTLREAWNRPGTKDSQRVDWLIQACQGLAKTHSRSTLYNAVSPDELCVDARGRLIFPDFSLAVKWPVSRASALASWYTAPELTLSPESADSRADLYALGATWYSLLLGRRLCERDFETEFEPARCTREFPDAHPLLIRLLLRTFARGVEQRFPSEEERGKGTSAVTELQRQLLVYKQSLNRPILDVAGQTSVGVQRGANEDNHLILKARGKVGEESQELALAVVADGMGGAAAGEVASEITIHTIQRRLWPTLWEWLQKPPGDPQDAISSAIIQAIREANEAVVHHAEAHPQTRGMACTVDVVVILNTLAVVGHVGDSRVGLWRDGRLNWVTEDQTLVARLLRLGMITPAEADVHPDRSKLLQAVGSGTQIDPAIYSFELYEQDRLLCCSDGLTTHVDDATIGEIIERTPRLSNACNRLINEANVNGGSDNITVLLAEIAFPARSIRALGDGECRESPK